MLYVCCDLPSILNFDGKGTTKIAMSGFLKSQICFVEKPLMQFNTNCPQRKAKSHGLFVPLHLFTNRQIEIRLYDRTGEMPQWREL